jgi:hypothetical protein
VPEQKEGWLWDLGRVGKMSKKEMDDWSEEGKLFF